MLPMPDEFENFKYLWLDFSRGAAKDAGLIVE
jgi:hypothetical protein